MAAFTLTSTTNSGTKIQATGVNFGLRVGDDNSGDRTPERVKIHTEHCHCKRCKPGVTLSPTLSNSIDKYERAEGLA